MGISHGYLNDMLHGRKVFTEEMAARFLNATEDGAKAKGGSR